MATGGYDARHAFFAMARGAGPIWATLAGLVLVEVVWKISRFYLTPWPDDETGTIERTLVRLLLYLVMIVTVAGIVHLFQRRRPVSVVGPVGPACRDFLRAAIALLAFAVVLAQVPGWSPSGLTLAMPAQTWLLLLPLAVLGVLIQTGAEEYVFRGYLQQSLGARRDTLILWMILPSVLFGALHFTPSVPLGAALATVVWASAFGIAAADLTARTGNLGAAIGFHFAHNLPLVAFYAAPGARSGFALYAIPEFEGTPDYGLAVATKLVHILLLWFVCRIAIRR